MKTIQQFSQSKSFIIMIAALMGITSLAIDTILPTFPAVISDFNIPPHDHNLIQQMVFMYVLGFACLQIVYGTLSDVFGRKVLLLTGLIIYTIASVVAIFSRDYHTLLLMRFAQGVGLAAPRVIGVSIVRDLASGREMARIMSFVMMTFLAIPAIAPMLGQIIIAFLPWEAVFVFLFLAGLALLIWVYYSLPETLTPEARKPLNLKNIVRSFSAFFAQKASVLYLLIMSLLFATLMIYISLAEQILQKDIYLLGHLFPLVFAIILIGMVVSSVLNSRFVISMGMQKLSTIAIAIIIINDGLFFITTLVFSGILPLPLYLLFVTIHFFGFGLSMPNLNAMIMEPFADISGFASALSGMVSSIFGVFIAQTINSFYDKTLYCQTAGFLACTSLGVVIGYFANRYRRSL